MFPWTPLPWNHFTLVIKRKVLKGLHFICCCPGFYDKALKSFYTRLRPSTDKRAVRVGGGVGYTFSSLCLLNLSVHHYSQLISKVILWHYGCSSIETLFVHLFLQLFLLATTVVIVSPCLTQYEPTLPPMGRHSSAWKWMGFVLISGPFRFIPSNTQSICLHDAKRKGTRRRNLCPGPVVVCQLHENWMNWRVTGGDCIGQWKVGQRLVKEIEFELDLIEIHWLMGVRWDYREQEQTWVRQCSNPQIMRDIEVEDEGLFITGEDHE